MRDAKTDLQDPAFAGDDDDDIEILEVVGIDAMENINMSLRKVERYWTDQIRYIY